MIGWFPRYSLTGALIAEVSAENKYRSQWFTPEEPIWDDGNVLWINGQRTEHPSGNALAAGGGKWAVYRTDPPRIIHSDGRVATGAGSPAISPLGTHFAGVDNALGETKQLFLNDRPIDQGGIIEVRVSETLLAYKKNGEVWAASTADRVPHRRNLVAGEGWPIPIDTPDGPWLLSMTQTGIIVRPEAHSFGYRFDNGGNTFNPDGFYQDGVILVAFSDAHGVIVELPFPLGVTRVDLAASSVPPPIDNPPPPPPPPIDSPDPEPPMSQPMPENVVAIIARYAARFPVPQMSGPGPADEAFENECRRWCWSLAEQVHFETGDPRWGVKNAGGGRPQSKDALAFNGPRLIGYDTMGGVGTGHPTLVARPSGEDITGQTFMPVPAADHLGANTPTNPDPGNPSQPPPVPAGSGGAAIDRDLAALKQTIASLTARLTAVEARPAPTSPAAPASIDGLRVALRSVHRGTYMSNWDRTVAEFNRPDPGEGETFTIEVR